jgi:hypothetical protein
MSGGGMTEEHHLWTQHFTGIDSRAPSSSAASSSGTGRPTTGGPGSPVRAQTDNSSPTSAARGSVTSGGAAPGGTPSAGTGASPTGATATGIPPAGTGASPNVAPPASSDTPRADQPRRAGIVDLFHPRMPNHMPTEAEMIEQRLQDSLRNYHPDPARPANLPSPTDNTRPPDRPGPFQVDNPLDGATYDINAGGGVTVTPVTNFTDTVGVNISIPIGGGKRPARPEGEAESAPSGRPPR